MGNNGHNTVYSFLPVSGDVYSFRGDIYHFFTVSVLSSHLRFSLSSDVAEHAVPRPSWAYRLV